MPNPIEYMKYSKRAYLLKFARPDNQKRTTMRLGCVSKSHAKEIGLKVEQLLGIIQYRAPLPPDLQDWLANLSDRTYSKFVKGGLVAPRVAAPVSGLKEFLTNYCVEHVASGAWKPRTNQIRSQCVNDLVRFFSAERSLSTITSGDAEDWSQWLQKESPDGRGLNRVTIAKRVKDAKQFFGYAVRKNLVTSNPFEGIRICAQDNPDRSVEIPADVFDRVLAQISDREVRLILALGRYGGLRIPSEPTALKWDDIDFEKKSMRIPAPKTGVRHCPLFEELVPFLRAVRPEAPAEGSYVLKKYRGESTQYRTLVADAIKRAGLRVWPRLFHNLRANAFTDLCDRNGMSQVCKWLGNSLRTGEKHYLIVRKHEYIHAQRASTLTTTDGEGGEPSSADKKR